MMMYNKLSNVTLVFTVGLLCVLVAVLSSEALKINKPDIHIDKPDIDMPDIKAPHLPSMPTMSSLEMAALKKALKAVLHKVEDHIPGMGDD